MPMRKSPAVPILLAGVILAAGLSTARVHAADDDPGKLLDQFGDEYRQTVVQAREVCRGAVEASPQEAVDACTVAIERAGLGYTIGIKPLDEDEIAEMYVHRGNAYLAIDEVEGLKPATDDFASAIEIAPKNPAGYRARSRLFWKSENPLFLNIAVGDLAALLEIEPDNTALVRDLALAQAKLGQFDLALKHIEIALARGVEADRLVARGVIRLAAGIDGALDDFDQALALDPNNAEAYAGRALAYGIEAVTHLMIADLSKAIALAPSVAEYRLWRAAAQIDEARADAAMSDLYDTLARADMAIGNETAILAYAWRAITFSWQGLNGEAAADCRRARYLNQGEPAGVCGADDMVDDARNNADYHFGNINRIARAMVFHIAGTQ